MYKRNDMKVPYPVFVNFLRIPLIDFQPGGIDYSKSILGPINVYKYGLWMHRSFRHKVQI
jgi:hypothetical protein